MDITKKRTGSKTVALSEVAQLIQRMGPAPSLHVGIVYKPQASSHVEITDDDVLVHVKLMPEEQPVMCRLFTGAAGAGAGVWKVPKPGAEVLVGLPGDNVEAGPIIIAVSATGSVPSNLDEDTMTIDNPDGDVVVQGGTLKVARDTDAVKAATTMAQWITDVQSIVGPLYAAAHGGTPNVAPTDFGTIDGGADSFKA
jgi:hypothetical protein